MIDSSYEIQSLGKSVLKIILLFFFFVNIPSSFAAINQDSAAVIPADTVVASQLLKQDSIPFEDTFHNPFVKMYKYGITTGIINKKETADKSPKLKKDKKTDTTHYSPKKAAVWGAAFPGLGQVYNKKYWKLPIVYGVLGTVIYFVASNGQKLRTFNGYLRNSYNGIPNPSPYDQLELSEIETFRNSYRKNVQIASFGTIFAWGLSIVDAVVDAHLRHFDMSDKLSLKVEPELNYTNFTYYAGIGVHLNFK